MSVTLDGVVTGWNATAERLYGRTASQIIGRHASCLVPPDRARELETLFAAAGYGTPVGPFRTVRTHKDGHALDLVLSLTPLRDSTGAVVGVAESARRAHGPWRDGAPIPGTDPVPTVHQCPSLVVDEIPHIVWIAGPDGFNVYLNRWGTERLGVGPEAFYGSNWLRLLHPDDVEPARSRWEAAVRTGTSYVNEYRVRHPDGAYRWYLALAVGLRAADGTIDQWVGTWTDIDGRVKAEQKLARDSRLLASVRDSIVVTDMAGIVTHWNEGAIRVFGWTAEEMLGRPLLERFPREVRGAVGELVRRIEAGEEFSGEFEDYHKDGSRIWIDARVRLIFDDAGRPVGIMGVSHDITARKGAEDDRDRLYAQLRGHMERLPLGYIAFDPDGRIVDWNSSAERIFGYSKGEALGMVPPYEAILPESAWTDGQRVIARIRAGDMTAHAVNQNRTKDGRTIVCEWYNTPLVDADGRFLGFVSLAQDVSDRKAAEMALKRSEERFRQIAESISEVFWLTSVDKAEVEYISPAYERIWGRSREHVFTHPQAWIEAIHPEDRDRVSRAAHNEQDSGEYEQEYRVVRPDGTERWIRDRAFPVRDANGTVVRVAGVAEDITARRQLEAQLRQAQKMEAIGQLAGGVAHDFNNLLTVIMGYSELLVTEVSLPDHRELVEEILRAGERSAALTRQLLAFSRKQVLAPRILDLNAVVLDMEKMLRRLIGEDIDLTTRLGRSLPAIRADQGQLEQVLLNLAVNARDAMPAGGHLTISTSADSSLVVLEVKDTGVGMTEAVKRRVFEPFFTTKEAGKGTGLGLAVVHGFVEQSNGQIHLDSAPGCGTVFRISLPAADRAAAVGNVPSAIRLAAGEETVLVVEDDEGVRALTKRMLERCGYSVLSAAGAEEALRIARDHPGPIHLLLTDVVMPGIGGRAIAEELGGFRAETRVLYVSGYTDDAVLQRGVLTESANFLQKPFSQAGLAERVRAVLTGGDR
jgi:PAS domain S-box-containing protein